MPRSWRRSGKRRAPSSISARRSGATASARTHWWLAGRSRPGGRSTPRRRPTCIGRSSCFLDPAPQFELGFALWRKGLAADAAVHLRQAATLAPEQASTHYYPGEALNQAGDHAGALAALERAAALEPTYPKPFQLMGRVLDRQGRPEEAMQMYRRAREAQPQ
jgi:tetratricopeptide (TPR) repeat protein